MSRRSRAFMIARMRVAISFEEDHPPSGVLTVDDGPGVAFVGWLGLLHMLAEALDADAPAGMPDRLGGELAPRGDAELGPPPRSPRSDHHAEPAAAIRSGR